MLDHRNTTASSLQYSNEPGVWTREMNDFGWRCLLGDLTDGEVPAYVSPALADDLAGLPTTHIDTGSAEVFRDEDTDYATRIWTAGGQAESNTSRAAGSLRANGLRGASSEAGARPASIGSTGAAKSSPIAGSSFLSGTTVMVVGPYLTPAGVTRWPSLRPMAKLAA
jgi:hypothetical protein